MKPNRTQVILFILFWSLLLVLCSCGVHKAITTTKIEYDSAAIHEADSLKHLLVETTMQYENTIRELMSTGVQFQTDTLYQDTGRVEFYPDGSLKSVEGRLKSVTQSKDKAAKEASIWRQKYDSLASFHVKDSVAVVTKYVQTEKKVTRFYFPWWLLLIGFVAGCAFWHFKGIIFNRLKTISMKTMIFIFLISIGLMSCGHFHDAPTVSVWAEGGWLIFWLPFLGGVAFVVAAIAQSKSGSSKQDLQRGTQYSKENIVWWKQNYFKIGAILLLISIGIVIYFNSSAWR